MPTRKTHFGERIVMAVQISITVASGVYSISPQTPNSLTASAFELTNNCPNTVTVYFQVTGNAASPFPASQDIAAGGNYTTPTLNSGSVVFVITAQGASNPIHVIHIGSTMHPY
jgi:hypothetical protein